MSSVQITSRRSSIPERANILFFILSELGHVVTELKLQKLVFQVQNIAKVPRGYRYKRHLYGPYSRELNIDTFTLAKKGLIKREEVRGVQYPYWRFEITPPGEAYFKERALRNLTRERIQRMRKVLNEYKGYSHYQLAEMVYQQWRIRKPEALRREMAELAKNLQGVTSFWESAYFPGCPAITYFLAFAEYLQDALSKALSLTDTVVKSVLLMASKEFHDKLMNIAQVCSKEDVCPLDAQEGLCQSSDPSLYEVFDFIEDLCQRNDVLPKLLSRKRGELVTEDEYVRLQKSLKTLNVSVSS